MKLKIAALVEKIFRMKGGKNANLELTLDRLVFKIDAGDENFEECLRQLKDSYRTNQDKIHRAYYSQGLVSALRLYKRAKDIEGMRRCLNELYGLYSAFPDADIGHDLCRGYFEMIRILGFRKSSESSDRIVRYIDRARQVYSTAGDPDIRKEYVYILTYAISYYGNDCDLRIMEKYLQELRDVYEKDADSLNRAPLAGSLVVSANTYKVVGDLDGMVDRICELRELCKDRPDKLVHACFADGLVIAVNCFSIAHCFDKLELFLGELRELYTRSPDSKLGERLAHALFYAATGYVYAGDTEKVDSIQSELAKLYDSEQMKDNDNRYSIKLANVIKNCSRRVRSEDTIDAVPKTEDTANDSANVKEYNIVDTNRKHEAGRLLRIVAGYADSMDFGHMEEELKKLEMLQALNCDSEAKDKLAIGLSIASSAYGKSGNLEKMECYLKLMKNLYGSSPASSSPVVIVQFGYCLSRVIMSYGRAGKYGLMEGSSDELKKLYAAHPLDVGKYLAQGLSSEAACYGRANDYDNVERCLKELRELAGKPRESVLIENLAAALSTVSVRYGKAGNLSRMNRLLDELKGLYRGYPGGIIAKELCFGLSGKMGLYMKNDDIDGVESLINELSDLYGIKHDGKIAITLAYYRYRALMRHGRDNRLECVEDHVRRLKELSIIDPGVKKYLTLSLSYVTIAYYKAENKLKADNFLFELFNIYDACLDEEVAYYVSNAIAHALTRYGKEANAGMMEECVARLRRLDKAYPKMGTDEKLLYALSYLSIFHGKVGDFEKIGECIAEAKELYKAHPSLDMARELCRCLTNAMTSYEKAENADKIGECAKELKKFYQAYNDKNIATACSYGLCRALIFMGRSERQGLMYDYLTELKSVCETYQDSEILGYYARGLSNAGIIYGRAGWYDNMTECTTSLKSIYREHPDQIVRQELAICLFNTRTIRLRLWQEYYENLTLLYKLRFDVPGTNQQDKIRQIETLFIEETAKTLSKQHKAYTPEELEQALKELTGKDVETGPLAKTISDALE